MRNAEWYGKGKGVLSPSEFAEASTFAPVRATADRSAGRQSRVPGRTFLGPNLRLATDTAGGSAPASGEESKRSSGRENSRANSLRSVRADYLKTQSPWERPQDSQRSCSSLMRDAFAGSAARLLVSSGSASRS
jgi:hypothetical protein